MAATDTGRRDATPERQADREGRSSAAGPRVADSVRDRVSDELNARKTRVSDMLGGVADTVRRFGEPLRDIPIPALGDYADGAADRIEHLATDLRERDVAELAGDIRDLARRRPAIVVGAGFAVGVLAARLLKGSMSEATQVRKRAAAPGGGARTSAPAGGSSVASRSRRQPPGASRRVSRDRIEGEVHGKEEDTRRRDRAAGRFRR
jgi:hypothetical protein